MEPTDVSLLSPVSQLIVDGKAKCLKKMIVEDPSVLNVIDKSTGLYPIHTAVRHGQMECLQKLVSADGIQLNVKTQRSCSKTTALFMACRSRQPNFLDMCKLLIENGASVDERCDVICGAKQTCLHTAFVREPLSLELCQLLVDSHASFNACDDKEKTPLVLAMGRTGAARDQLIDFMLRNTAIGTLVLPNGEARDDVFTFLDCRRNTIAHFASFRQDLNILQRIIEHAVGILAQRNSFRHTTMSSAVVNQHPHSLELMLQNGVSPFEVINSGRIIATPICRAVRSQHHEPLELILRYVSAEDIARYERNPLRVEENPVSESLRCGAVGIPLLEPLLRHGFHPDTFVENDLFTHEFSVGALFEYRFVLNEFACNLPRYSTCSVLGYALSHVPSDEDLEWIVDLLLEYGASPNPRPDVEALMLTDLPPLISLMLRSQANFRPGSCMWRVFDKLVAAGADVMLRTPRRIRGLAQCPDLVVFSACLGNPFLLQRMLAVFPQPMAVLHDLLEFVKRDHSFLDKKFTKYLRNAVAISTWIVSKFGVRSHILVDLCQRMQAETDRVVVYVGSDDLVPPIRRLAFPDEDVEMGEEEEEWIADGNNIWNRIMVNGGDRPNYVPVQVNNPDEFSNADGIDIWHDLDRHLSSPMSLKELSRSFVIKCAVQSHSKHATTPFDTHHRIDRLEIPVELKQFLKFHDSEHTQFLEHMSRQLVRLKL